MQTSCICDPFANAPILISVAKGKVIHTDTGLVILAVLLLVELTVAVAVKGLVINSIDFSIEELDNF